MYLSNLIEFLGFLSSHDTFLGPGNPDMTQLTERYSY